MGPVGGYVLCIYPGSRLGLALYSPKYFPSGPYSVLLPVVVLVPMICLPVTPAVYLGTGHGRSSSTEQFELNHWRERKIEKPQE